MSNQAKSAPDYLIFGSQAMKHNFPDFPRVPMDNDIIISEERYYDVVATRDDIEYINEREHGFNALVKFKDISTPFEYFFADKQGSLKSIMLFYGDKDGYATPEILYSFKKSHLYYPIKFKKHIHDFMFLRRKLREKYNISLEQDLDADHDLLDRHIEVTESLRADLEERHGKVKTPKMNQSSEEFFGKSKKFVKSYYVHDDMHKAVAMMYKKTPIYEQIIKDGSQVETDFMKWVYLSMEDRINCVLEEVYVIALERKILPLLFEHNQSITQEEAKKAFDWALYRVCTTLCDGFFREYACRAYDQIQERYNNKYVEIFFENISKFDDKTIKREENKEESSGNTSGSS